MAVAGQCVFGSYTIEHEASRHVRRHLEPIDAHMKTLAIVFHSELEKVGSFFVPGVGLFQSVYTPPMPGRMKSVCGAKRAIPPQPSKTSVKFTPFKEVVDLLSETKHRLEGPGERAGGSASAEAPAGLVDLNSPEQHSSSDGDDALKDVQPQTPK